MPYLKIYPDCHPPNSEADYCFHYVVQEHKYNLPHLHPCLHDDAGEPYLAKKEKCSDWISKRPKGPAINGRSVLFDRCARPNIPETPIWTRRPIVSTMFKDRELLHELLGNIIGGDFWGAYLRDADTLEELEFLYYVDGQKQEIEINNFTDENDLIDRLNDTNELVLVMNKDLCDYYVRKIADKYMIIGVDINKIGYLPV